MIPLTGSGWATGMYAVSAREKTPARPELLELPGAAPTVGKPKPRLLQVTCVGELRKAGDTAVAQIDIGHAWTDKEKKVRSLALRAACCPGANGLHWRRVPGQGGEWTIDPSSNKDGFTIDVPKVRPCLPCSGSAECSPGLCLCV